MSPPTIPKQNENNNKTNYRTLEHHINRHSDYNRRSFRGFSKVDYAGYFPINPYETDGG